LSFFSKIGTQNALNRGLTKHKGMVLGNGEEGKYTVTFLGPAQNDLGHVTKLANGLKERFKLSDEVVTKMMRTAPVIIKKGATAAEAERYKAALEAMGARVNVAPARGMPREGSAPVQDTDEGPVPLDREPQVIPVRAKTPPPAESTASPAPSEPTTPQMVTCPQCGFGQSATDECVKCGVIISKFLKYQGEVKDITEEGDGTVLPTAGTPVTQGAPAQSQRISGSPISEPTGSTPWEEMASLGFITALFRTMKQVLFSPKAFFSAMPVNKGVSGPLFYAVIISFFGTTVGLLAQFALSGFMGSTAPEGGGMPGVGVSLFQTAFLIIYAIALPILLVIGFFIASGIFHVCLLIVGAGKRGFEATFRVVAYTTSSQVFALIPFLGAFIITIYNLVLWTIGFREVHRTTTGRAFVAVLLPMVVVIFFIVLIVLAVIIPLIFSHGQMPQPQAPSIE
jgi:hypothetical protein